MGNNSECIGAPVHDQSHLKALLTNMKASLYYMDGGDETRNLLEASGEPWRPLSRFICSESPHVKHRTVAEIQDLKSERDKYRYEYAQRKSWLHL